MSQTPALALLGNPGAGKSTILNGAAGRPVFASGLSLGEGLTTEIKYYQTDLYLLCDTPGLADISNEREAIEQINSLLMQNRPLKIAFVVTLDSGSVRPQDAKTINLVLSAISGVAMNDSFGVIVNQVSAAVQSIISNQTNSFDSVKRGLLGTRWTSYWCVVGLEKSLREASNGMLMPAHLRDFLDSLPVTRHADASVKTMRASKLPVRIAPKTWTWADSKLKIRVPRRATLRWTCCGSPKSHMCCVTGPVAVVLERKWIWSDVELLITGS